MRMTTLVSEWTLALLFAAGAAIGHAQTSAAGNQPELASFPFWQQMAGCWEGDNTYFDSNMDYTVRTYNSLVKIELSGATFRETEHRFYPAGVGPSRYAKGLARPGEGVELVVVTTGELIDDAGSLGSIRMDHTALSSGPNVVYRVLSNNDGVRLNTNPDTGVDTYRMYFNFITPDRRLRSNVGLYSKADEKLGGLRAFILYRDHRIQPATFAARRAALRQLHNVTVINESDPEVPGQSLARRLDD